MEIPNFNKYKIFTDGRLYNIKRKIFMKTQLDNKGYERVNLINDDREVKACRIHRLLAITWIPNPENKEQVDHVNRIRNDNRLFNLRWATACENQQNTGLRITNTSGIKNIHFHIKKNYWIYKKTYKKKSYCKYFKTLEEAIKYKEEHELNITYPPGYYSLLLHQ